MSLKVNKYNTNLNFNTASNAIENIENILVNKQIIGFNYCLAPDYCVTDSITNITYYLQEVDKIYFNPQKTYGMSRDVNGAIFFHIVTEEE